MKRLVLEGVNVELTNPTIRAQAISYKNIAIFLAKSTKNYVCLTIDDIGCPHVIELENNIESIEAYNLSIVIHTYSIVNKQNQANKIEIQCKCDHEKAIPPFVQGLKEAKNNIWPSDDSGDERALKTPTKTKKDRLRNLSSSPSNLTPKQKRTVVNESPSPSGTTSKPKPNTQKKLEFSAEVSSSVPKAFNYTGKSRGMAMLRASQGIITSGIPPAMISPKQSNESRDNGNPEEPSHSESKSHKSPPRKRYPPVDPRHSSEEDDNEKENANTNKNKPNATNAINKSPLTKNPKRARNETETKRDQSPTKLNNSEAQSNSPSTSPLKRQRPSNNPSEPTTAQKPFINTNNHYTYQSLSSSKQPPKGTENPTKGALTTNRQPGKSKAPSSSMLTITKKPATTTTQNTTTSTSTISTNNMNTTKRTTITSTNIEGTITSTSTSEITVGDLDDVVNDELPIPEVSLISNPFRDERKENDYRANNLRHIFGDKTPPPPLPPPPPPPPPSTDTTDTTDTSDDELLATDYTKFGSSVKGGAFSAGSTGSTSSYGSTSGYSSRFGSKYSSSYSFNSSWNSTTVGKGMRNIGNTCYLNAVLQSLLSLKPFTKDLISTKLTSLSLSPNSFYTSLLNVYREVAKSNHGVINPKPVKDAVGDNESRFRGFSQQDAHEFLSASLNLLSEELFAHLRGKGKDKDNTNKIMNGDNNENSNSKQNVKTKDNNDTDEKHNKDTKLDKDINGEKITTTTLPIQIDLTDTPLERPYVSIFCTSDSVCNFSNNNENSNCNSNSTSHTNHTTHKPETNGANGANGTYGTNGTNETNGTNGANGANETNGPNGPNGTSVINGTIEPTGANGTNGAADAKPKNLYEDIAFRTTICPTSKNFDCEVEAKYTCKKCKDVSRVKELYRDFSLDIPRPDELELLGLGDDLDPPCISDLLQIFFREEEIEKKCEKCAHSQARLRKRITKLPNVLVLHIKRFLPDPETMTYDKNKDKVKSEEDFFLDSICDTNVCFPPAAPKAKKGVLEEGEILVKDSQPSGPKRRIHKYVLHCIVMHRGYGAQGGHYVAYVHDEKDNDWKCFDDSVVREVSTQKVMSEMQDGYIFFYMYDNLSV